jgi:phosphonopyruvate decarboxylase
MPSLSADAVLTALRRSGFDFVTGVPCSYLTPLINAVILSDDVRYVPATNEGDAIAIAAGAEIAGRHSVTMFQNSGLGNAVNPLTSLTHTFELPTLVVTTWRGQPGGAKDEPQHDLMGAITAEMLAQMQIPTEVFPADAEELQRCLERARAHMDEHHRPYALILEKGSIEPISGELPATPDRDLDPHVDGSFDGSDRLHPDEALATLQQALGPRDVLVTTTGFCGRALYAIGDRRNQLYMVGSMGCASSFALGIALCHPDRRVFVADGDGALLMRMGALATIGTERPANLCHVLLDNGVHDSTGAQATVSPAIDLAMVASACGYDNSRRVATAAGLREALQQPGRLTFLHVRTLPRADRKLPRPTETPPQIADRLRAFRQE